MGPLGWATLLACNGGKDGDEPVSGSITVAGNTAEVPARKAFAYELGGRMLAVLAANESASCTGITQHMAGGDPRDPSDLFEPGACNVTLVVDGWSEPDGFQATDDPTASLSTAIECAFGEGHFQLEDRKTVGEDYYYTGPWWVGHPTAYAWDFRRGDGEDLVLDMTMTRFDGSFIYDLALGQQPGDGDVAGTATAEWCPELENTYYF